MTPRNIRNFWITADIDGRPSPVSGGPTRKDGGISLTVKQRDNDSIINALEVIGRAYGDGTIVLTVYAPNPNGKDMVEVAVVASKR